MNAECAEANAHASAGVCRGIVDQKSGFTFYDCSEVDGSEAAQDEPDERGFLPPATVKVYQIIDTGEPYGPPEPGQ